MNGKVVVITGASGGIGAAASSSVASRGASVVLVARRETELRAERCGEAALPVVADVTKRDDVRRVVHDSPDSRTLPNAQNVEEVGEVIAWVVETRRPDVYAFRGAKQMITAFQSQLGEDPPA